MMIKSLSDKRLLVECEVNGIKAPFLIDTGASVSLIDEDAKKKYKLEIGKKFNKPLIGAGGEIKSSYLCNTFVFIKNKKLSQFIFSDISNIQESIKHETGYKILGIIGLPLMKSIGMLIDLLNNGILV